VHNNYYFLRLLAPALEQRLQGATLELCFSQEKDELVLGFALPEKDFYIRAALHPEFSALSFPENFKRARQNSIDLFAPLIGQAFTGAHVYLNERALRLDFENHHALLFKMYGSRSNILHIRGPYPQSLFKNNMVQDRQLQADALDRPLPTDWAAFEAANGAVQKVFPMAGPLVRLYLNEQGYAHMDLAQQWQAWQHTEALLKKPEHYYIVLVKDRPHLSLLPVGQALHQHTNPIDALNGFFRQFTREYYLEKQKQGLVKQLERQRKQTEGYLKKVGQRLQQLTTEARYEELGHIIMANLHQIKQGSKQVTLHDFYNDAPIDIKLKETLSPQKNAEVLYRKAKNQKIEEQKLRENMGRKEEQLLEVLAQIETIEDLENFKALRQYEKAHGLDNKPAQQQEQVPYKELLIDGYKVWVGRNAKANDELTLKYAHKEDLWLHAKDVSGSHVIIKVQPGKAVPNGVLEKAAQVAAWHSKGKNNSLCPVIYTPKKFVRKPKGLPPGAVRVDREAVIMVPPAPVQEI